MQAPKPLLIDKFFQDNSSSVEYSSGQIVDTSENEKQDTYYLQSGFVKSYFISNEGNYNILTLYGAGTVFPLGPILRKNFGRTPYHLREVVYFETMSTARIASYPYEALLKFCEDNPQAYKELITLLLTNNELYLSRVEASLFRQAYHRIIHQLVVLAELFSYEVYGQLIISVPLTHQDLANTLGMARETVSREIEKLKQAGLIDTKDQRIIINDYKKLIAELE